jgi:hypothetical protein
MDTQQMMELLLVMNEKIEANTKAMNEIKYETIEDRTSDREEMKQVITAGQEQLQENLMRMMEEMKNANQAKINVKLEELSETIEETRVEGEELTSADMNACQETTAYQDAI